MSVWGPCLERLSFANSRGLRSLQLQTEAPPGHASALPPPLRVCVRGCPGALQRALLLERGVAGVEVDPDIEEMEVWW